MRKGIKGLEKQIVKHQKKIEEYQGPKDILIDYWKGEIDRMEREKEVKERKLKKR